MTYIPPGIHFDVPESRDQAELDHALAGIREAADRLAMMLHSPSGGRVEDAPDV